NFRQQQVEPAEDAPASDNVGALAEILVVIQLNASAVGGLAAVRTLLVRINFHGRSIERQDFTLAIWVCIANADRCEIGQNRILAPAFRTLAPYNRKAPVLVILIGIWAKELRIASADDELEVVLAAETQRACATLIELPLNKLDVHLVAL